MPEAEYQEWQVGVLDLWWKHTADGGACFYNHKLRYRKRKPIVPLAWLQKTKWSLRQEIIWDRGGGVVLNAGMFIPCDERWYWLEKPGKHVWNGLGKNRTNIWKGSTTEASEHVVDYPVQIVAIPIEFVSNTGDVIVDPFLGSGTTMVAAEQLGRVCHGIEIAPQYVAVTLERMKDLGLEPQLAEK
jgi:modification methylase